MYTRHYYNINDVSAALQYAIHIKRPYEAVFWAKELKESESILLQKTLFMGWFNSIGLSNLNCIEIIKNPTYESIFQMVSTKFNCSYTS